MKRNYLNTALYYITTVILFTLAILFYWNLKNYGISKKQLKNEVQICFDEAVDNYFIEKNKYKAVKILSSRNPLISLEPLKPSLNPSLDSGNVYSLPSKKGAVEVIKFDPIPKEVISGKSEKIIIGNIKKKNNDSLNNDQLKEVLSKLITSTGTLQLNYKELDSLLEDQFARKNLQIKFGLHYQYKGQSITYNKESIKKSDFSIETQSTWLPQKSKLTLFYTNLDYNLLKRNLIGIILSVILATAVVLCVFYLLKVIARQKNLDEMKNDLISNITHEFKTPISTIQVALEGIQNFNEDNDPKKIRKYIKTSNFQLGKLNHMVEKLLELATLSSGELPLELKRINLHKLLQRMVNKYQNLHAYKIFYYLNKHKNLQILVDPFHFENAIENLLDNAVKYGGNMVNIYCYLSEKNYVKISIHDNGNSLSPANTNKIFDKFYRVPTGNTHDIKGFGIGLYYTRQILENHGGTINVKLDNTGTSFIIGLPHEFGN